MPGADLTPKQVAFLEEYVGIPKFFGRSKAKKLRAQYEVEFARFNVEREWVEGRIDALADKDVAKRLKLELTVAEDIVVKGDSPDFEGGHIHLVSVNQAVDSQKLVAELRGKLALVQPMVETALTGTRLDKHDEISMLWTYGNDQAESGMRALNPDRMKSAMAALDKLAGVIANAKPAPGQDLSGIKDDARAVMEAKTAQAMALADLLAAEARRAKTDADLKTAFDNSVPAALTQMLTEAKQLIDGAPKADTSKTGGDLAAEALATLSGYSGVIWWGDADTARAYAATLARREGPILPVLTAMPDRAHVAHERHVCVDTTASGGNAALLAEAGSA